MKSRAELWVVVLAGGEGRRVRALTRDARGSPVPKQFCRFGTDRSLLRRVLERAGRLTSSEHTLVVVSDAHRRWWEVDLMDHPPRNIVSGPADRGTGIAILRAALEISGRDSDAVVLVMPSDYEVLDEDTLTNGLVRTIDEARAGQRLVLAGMQAEVTEPELGWIVPTAPDGHVLRGVKTFIEKPNADLATQLAGAGALVSSFMMAATVRLLLRLYGWVRPDLIGRLAMPSGSAGIPFTHIVDEWPALDFSRDLLEHSRSQLGVVAVPPCGWTDLGTPERLSRWLNLHALELAPTT